MVGQLHQSGQRQLVPNPYRIDPKDIATAATAALVANINQVGRQGAVLADPRKAAEFFVAFITHAALAAKKAAEHYTGKAQ